jgi:hypothetical protein
MNYVDHDNWFEFRNPCNVQNDTTRLVYEPIPNEGNYKNDLYSRILKELNRE